MDYENDDISNDTTHIVQTGASSVLDQEGTSALKVNSQEDALNHDVHCVRLTTKGGNLCSCAHLISNQLNGIQSDICLVRGRNFS